MSKLLKSFLVLALTAGSIVQADTVTDERLRTLAYRLTGLDPRPADMVSIRQQLGPQATDAQVAEYFTGHPDFTNIRLASFASKLSNETAEPYEPIDDFQVAVLASIRQGLNFQSIFTQAFSLALESGTFLTATFEPAFELGRIFQSQDEMAKGVKIVLNPAQPLYTEGLFVTDGFAKRFLSNGTNRRQIRAVFDVFLCTKIERWKDATLDPYYIGQDVSRFPGGKNDEFKDNCSSCHAPMDAMRGAWAYFTYSEQARIVQKTSTVQEKYLLNGDVTKEIYNLFGTSDDSWENLLIEEVQQNYYGWRTETSGKGPRQFATMITSARRFDECMTMRVLQEFCELPSEQIGQMINHPEFKRLYDGLRTSGYNMKNLISETVRSSLCEAK